MSVFQPRLVDTLLSAEKHSHASNQPINPYRRLLVCDLLPLLATDTVNVDLNSKLLFKLLHKSIEFYLCCLGMLPFNAQTTVQESDLKIDEPWNRLFGVLELVGKHLGWEGYMTHYGKNW